MNERDYMIALTDAISAIEENPKKISEVANVLYKKYKVPVDVTIDLLTKKDKISTTSPELLYVLGEGLQISVENYHPNDVTERMMQWKYQIQKLPKNLEFKAWEICEDQWSGRIMASELMMLRDAQKINYNPNAQRVMKRYTKGTEECFRIWINQKAVKEMEELFENGTFIPNAITLNMPEGTDFDYSDDGIVTIKHIKHFDITDGYHRYIAMSNVYNKKNKEWDYPMGLRITNYTDAKSRQLIFQEDQKTKMRKVDSNSMNTASIANKVVQRLNVDNTTNLNGLINTTGGIIDAAELAEIIQRTYFLAGKTDSRVKELLAEKKAREEIADGLRAVTEERPEVLEKHWSRYFLYCLIYNVSTGIKDSKQLLEYTDYMAEEAKKEKMFRTCNVTRVDLRRLSELRKKCAIDV